MVRSVTFLHIFGYYLLLLVLVSASTGAAGLLFREGEKPEGN
jgi:hypothetical protein